VKRVIADSTRTLILGALAAACLGGCDTNLPVDNSIDNVFVPPPLGIIQGSVSYFGPAPCVKDGKVQGRLVALLFAYDNPPPPDGLATTALNFATIPGEKFFSNTPIPSTGPGSKGNPSAKCPAKGDPYVATSGTFTITQVVAGNYQIRGFYSQSGAFNPLFDFANLPLANDVGGAVLSDATTQTIAKITVGVPDSKGTLQMPSTGFMVQNVPLVIGQLLTTGRPYFWIDPMGSHGFKTEPPKPGDVVYPQGATLADADFVPTFPQDWSISGEQNLGCLDDPDPACDLFSIAQASLPQLHLRYGFPAAGKNLGSGTTSSDELGLARSSRLKSPLQGGTTPFYGLEPFPLDPGAADIAATQVDDSQRFTLTRVYSKNYKTGVVGPSILVDNDALETAGYIAELYPLVVLAKLQENGDGLPVDPPTPQTDPVVVIQGITLRNDVNGNGTMKATSESPLACGGLTKVSGGNCVLDTSKPLTGKGSEHLDNMTTLIRPAALCVRPEKSWKGVLVAPFEQDSKKNQLVNKDVLLKAQASKLYDIQFGCLPPGYYMVNVIYPTGQAWSVPNNTGYCSFGLAKLINGQYVDGQPAEDCLYGAPSGTTFDKRPLLASQQVFLDAAPHGTPGKNTKPLILRIEPSTRCMAKDAKGSWNNNATNEDVNFNAKLDATEDKNGNGILDMRIPDACLRACRPGEAANANCAVVK
jgi:hypothetical protein